MSKSPLSYIKELIFLTLFYCFPASVFSQTGEIEFRHYTADDGLMHNTICRVVQDKKGYIWIGTGGSGLCKFDGRTFTNYSYDKNKPGSLGGNTVFTLLVDNKGTLWAGTFENGVSKYIPETNSFQVFSHSDSNPGTLDNNYVRSLFQDSEGTIYVGTATGLNLLDPMSGKVTRVISPIIADIFSIIENDKHQILVSSRQGLLLYNKKTKELRPYPFYNKTLSELTEFIFPLIQDSKGNYWLGRSKSPSIVSVDGTNLSKGNDWFGRSNVLIKITDLEKELFEMHPFNPGNPNLMLTRTNINSIKEDRNGNIWIGSNKGLSCLDPVSGNFKHFQYNVDKAGSLSHNDVYDIFIDNENNFWVGTEGNGLNYFISLPPRLGLVQHKERETNSLNNNIISCFTKIGDFLYIGTTGGGLNAMNQKTGQYKFYTCNSADQNSLSSNNVQSVYKDNDKNLWVGTLEDGLNLFISNTGTFKRFLEGTKVYSMVDDDDPAFLWLANVNSLKRMNKKTGKFNSWQPGSHPDSLHPLPTLVYRTSDNRLWIANNDNGGLAWFDKANKRFINYSSSKTDPNSLCNNGVISLCEDRDDHQLWIGTKNGLNKFDYHQNKFRLYTTSDGLPSNNISGILVDNQGNLWISTHYGLSRFDKSKGKFNNYTKDDGMQGVEFSLNACYKADDGKLFFGGKNGYNEFYPENVKTDSVVPPVVLTGFNINNRPASYGGIDSVLRYHISETKEIVLSYSQRSFSIEFTALNFISPGSNRYAYKLENFDKSWIAEQSANVAVYTNVPPGEYTFLVKAANSDGIYSNDPIRLKITVLPPFWKTAYAYFAYFLIISLSLFIFAKYLVETANRKHTLRLQKLNDRREKEIARLKIDFFTNIAHEIRTPLTLIRGPLDRLLKTEQSSPETLEEYEVMHKNTNHLLKLVNQLMNFRKIEDNKYVLNYRRINIVEVLREIYTRFTPLARQKQIEFNFVSDCDYYEIALDQELFISAVSNLLTNAFKFTKSSIGLSLTTSFPTTSGDSDRNHVKISVRDNGIGIPDGKLKMIFDPFFQIADQKTENTTFSGIGLGLSYTKSIVELHSGLLLVDSKPGEGSEFSIELPDYIFEPEVTTQEQAVDNNTDIYETASDITNIRTNENNAITQGVFLTTDHPEILIVEDNEDLRQFLSRQLQRQYLIHLAENGLKAIGILKKREIQLIITDLMMPEMDGIELCKHIKKNIETSHIPVIILTAKATIESKIEGTEIGADAYLEKPFSFEYLSVLIKNLIDNRALLKANFTRQPFSTSIEIAHSKTDEKFLSAINEIIQKNLENPDFSIDELAQALSISRSGFHRKLKGISALTPNDYIKLIRLKKAAELLRDGQLRVNEICDKVGFNSPSYFSKCFQEQFGMLPSDFAKT